MIKPLIESKMKGEIAQLEEKRPKKPVAKSMVLGEHRTLKSLTP